MKPHERTSFLYSIYYNWVIMTQSIGYKRQSFEHKAPQIMFGVESDDPHTFNVATVNGGEDTGFACMTTPLPRLFASTESKRIMRAHTDCTP